MTDTLDAGRNESVFARWHILLEEKYLQTENALFFLVGIRTGENVNKICWVYHNIQWMISPLHFTFAIDWRLSKLYIFEHKIRSSLLVDSRKDKINDNDCPTEYSSTNMIYRKLCIRLELIPE